MDKSREKSPKKRRGRVENLIPGKGRGPKKGAPNAGRPPDWWKQEMREGRDRYLIAAKAAGILEDPDHPLYHTMGKFFHEAVDGRPRQEMEHSGTVTLEALLAQSHAPE